MIDEIIVYVDTKYAQEILGILNLQNSPKTWANR
jgi:hypothetical protein